MVVYIYMGCVTLHGNNRTGASLDCVLEERTRFNSTNVINYNHCYFIPTYNIDRTYSFLYLKNCIS